MAPESSSPVPKGGMSSLYANLLDPSASSDASISRAPVVFKQASSAGAADVGTQEDAKKQQSNAAALRFQPNFRRPQPTSVQRPKPKVSASQSVAASPASHEKKQVAGGSQKASLQQSSSNNLAKWTSLDDDDDVNGFFAPDKPQRGGRKKRKKNKQDSSTIAKQDWDDIYDPMRPNSYDEYKNSEERYRDIRDWKDRLYAHRYAREAERGSDSEDGGRNTEGRRFYPPPSSAFAPPPNLNDASSDLPPPPPPPPPAPTVSTEAASGDDAFARRAQFSQARPPPPPPTPSQSGSGVISKAPIRYNLPSAPASLPKTDTELAAHLNDPSVAESDRREGSAAAPASEDAPRSLRPGQSGFAARLMKKHGWNEGKGLGAANNEGILNALRVKVEKAKRKPDSEGGGTVGPPGARGTIIGGKIKKKNEDGEEEGPGNMSEVVVLENMVNGMDLEAEMEGLVQEIGEECAEKYGRVERVYIHAPRSSSAQPKVFVKFTSQLSALRAVNALQGRIFNGNTIKAFYYDTEAFEERKFDAAL